METMTSSTLNITDPATVLLISTAVTAIISAIFVGIVNVIAALKTTAQLKENNAKTDSVINKVDQVHVLTNSNLSAVRAELEKSNQKVESLIATVFDMKSEREKLALEKAGLAAVAASAQTATPVNASPVVPGVPEVQKVKMVNTEDDPAIVKPVPEDKKL